ncbi:MAG: hypothetical protein WEF53_06820 [Bacteroidota bacterium]
MKHEKHTAPTYEVRDAHFRGLLYTGIGLLALIGLNLAISWMAYKYFEDSSAQPGEFPRTFATPKTVPPAPVLQPNPHADLVKLRAREDSVLTGYAWVNQQAGVARIPIDRAMEMLLRQGLPARPQQAERRR